jgi:hypothetical protein
MRSIEKEMDKKKKEDNNPFKKELINTAEKNMHTYFYQ